MVKIRYLSLAFLALILCYGCSVEPDKPGQPTAATLYPTLTPIPTSDNNVESFDTASFNEAGFLLAIDFSKAVSPNTYHLTLVGKSFPCVHFNYWPTLLFCVGEIRRVQSPIQIDLFDSKTSISQTIGNLDIEAEFPEEICPENKCTSSIYSKDCKSVWVFENRESPTHYLVCTDEQGLVTGKIYQDPVKNPTPTDDQSNGST